MAQLVERYVRNVQATSSNLVISTSQNLKRTTNYVFGLGFFFFTQTNGRLKYGKDYGFAQIGKALKNL